MKIKWRPYQLECKKAIKENYDQGVTNQLIVQATGTGKRIQSVDLSRHFQRTLFIAHREELIQQAQEEIELLHPFQTGIIKGSRFEIERKIAIASVQTLYNRLDRIDPELFDLVIVDEAHHYVSRTFLATIRHFKPKLRTVWTATPKRLDGLSLSNIAQKIVFEYRIQDGIREGHLSPMQAYQIKTGSNIGSVKKTAGDFNLAQLSVAVDTKERNEKIVDRYMKYSHGMQGIAFCVDIDHAYNLRDIFRENDISCEAVVSDESRCPNRSEIVQSFKNKEIDVLTNVNILTEGFDYSDIGVLMMARPTQSEVLYVQCMGRGTRLKSDAFKQKFGTDICTVLDFVDNTGRHSLINSYELEKDKPIEQRMFLPQKERDRLIEERERRVFKIIESQGSDKKVDLLRLPEVKPWNSEKMLEPATDKQIRWLMDIGLWQEDAEYTKLQASELISAQPAVGYQLGFLARHGYDISQGATLGQFQKVKWQVDQKNRFKIAQ